MTESNLTTTEIQGMMQGCFEPLTEIELGAEATAICLENGIWEVVDRDDSLVATINPRAVATAEEVRRLFSEATADATDQTHAAPPSE